MVGWRPGCCCTSNGEMTTVGNECQGGRREPEGKEEGVERREGGGGNVNEIPPCCKAPCCKAHRCKASTSSVPYASLLQSSLLQGLISALCLPVARPPAWTLYGLVWSVFYTPTVSVRHCHRFGLFPKARTNHTLPRNIRTQLKFYYRRGGNNYSIKGSYTKEEGMQLNGKLVTT